MRQIACLFLMCAVTFGIGCGGGADDRLSMVNASGKLYLDDQAHGGVNLTLEPVRDSPDDPRSLIGAEVAEDGSFTLQTYEPGDGAPPGKYTVRIVPKVGDSTDPNAMMAAAGGGTPIEPVTLEVPEGGSDSLEIRAKKSAAAPAKAKDSMLGGDATTP